jgi:peroxiredoxin
MFLLFTLALGLVAQTPNPPLTTFRGHIENALATDSIRLTVAFKDTIIAVDKRGDFFWKLTSLKQSTPTKFEYGNKQTQLYLTPGDQLVMRVDYKHFSQSIVYRGRGCKVNDYLAQSDYTFEYGQPTGALRLGSFPKGTPADARTAADSLRQARRDFLAVYDKVHALPAAFVQEQQIAFDCTWATQQLGYAFKHRSDAMPAGYFDFMRQVPVREIERLSTRGLIDNSRLANLIFGYPVRLAPQGKLSMDPLQGALIYDTATKELGNGQARKWAIGLLFQNNLLENAAGAKAFYQSFKRVNMDSTLARSLRESLLALEKLKGKPAPGFTLMDRNKKPVSLSDFRGKVVYLDFWGTWCAPCMRELNEFAPDLRQKLGGQDVVFLYISVGDAENKWLKTIANEHFTSFNSIHLRSTNGEIARLYNVDSFPSYFIIGRNGNIFQSYAPRPSDIDTISKALDKALKQ